MSDAKKASVWLPMQYGSALRVVGPEGHRFVEVIASVAGTDVRLGYVPLDAVVRHLMPEAGFVPVEEWNGTRLDVSAGPVCVGGPYDGRRMLKAAVPSGVMRVPVQHPSEMTVAPVNETPELAHHFDKYTSYSEGEYRLQSITGAPHGLRELWWWIPPKEHRAAAPVREGAE